MHSSQYTRVDCAYLGCVRKDVGDGMHGRFRWENVGIPHHELLQNVILDGSGELGLGHTLLLARHDEHGEHWDDGSVHGHGHGHLLQWDAIKEHLHILHSVDGHARHANVAVHPWVVRVIAAVRG